MNYLYFILPPIVIVISVALILLLLSKKSLNFDKYQKKAASAKKSAVKIQGKIAKIGKDGIAVFKKKNHLFQDLFLGLKNKAKAILKSARKNKEVVLMSDENKTSSSEDDLDKLVSKEDQAAVCEESVDINESSESKRFKRKTKRFGFDKKTGIVPKRSWKTLDFSKKDKQEENKKAESFSSDLKNEVVNDIAKKKNKKNAPMVSDEVVYPERRKKRKENKELENVLVERIAKDPRDVDAYERLGDYYEETENFQDALPCFKYVLKLSPDNKRAQVKIAEIEKEIEK